MFGIATLLVIHNKVKDNNIIIHAFAGSEIHNYAYIILINFFYYTLLLYVTLHKEAMHSGYHMQLIVIGIAFFPLYV